MSATDAPGLGIDLCEIARLERALERYPRLYERLFSPGERDYARGRRRPGRHLAARFAAKEATVKALGTPISMREVEVVADPAPRLELCGEAARLAAAEGLELTVSLSHTDQLAAAVVATK